jgi:hypothetical protein
MDGPVYQIEKNEKKVKDISPKKLPDWIAQKNFVHYLAKSEHLKH